MNKKNIKFMIFYSICTIFLVACKSAPTKNNVIEEIEPSQKDSNEILAEDEKPLEDEKSDTSTLETQQEPSVLSATEPEKESIDDVESLSTDSTLEPEDTITSNGLIVSNDIVPAIIESTEPLEIENNFTGESTDDEKKDSTDTQDLIDNTIEDSVIMIAPIESDSEQEEPIQEEQTTNTQKGSSIRVVTAIDEPETETEDTENKLDNNSDAGQNDTNQLLSLDVEQTTEPEIQTEPDADSSDEDSIKISQNIQAVKDSLFQVLLKGKGWIYLGETDSENIKTKYKNRIFKDEDTLFNFYAINLGTATLHFYKQDLLENDYNDVYIQVSVLESTESNENNADFSIENNKDKETDILDDTKNENSSSDGNTLTVINDDPSVSSVVEDSNTTEIENADELYNKAKEAYENNNFEQSLDYLDKFFVSAIDNLDKGWYLRGQCYEAQSPVKNIKKALEAYENLITVYPNSSLWQDTKTRINYIKRFYYNIH